MVRYLDDFAATVHSLAEDRPGHGLFLVCGGDFHRFSFFPVLHYERHKPVQGQSVVALKTIARTGFRATSLPESWPLTRKKKLSCLVLKEP